MSIPDNDKVFDEDRVAERTADVIDQAGAVSEMMLKANLNSARGKSAPETHPDFDGEHCIACGADIPKERVALGRIKCVGCQQAIEIRNKQHQRR